MRYILRMIILFVLTWSIISVGNVQAANDNGTDKISLDPRHFKIEMTYPDNDQSQLGLDMAAGREFKRADDTLNIIYNKVLTKHKGDKIFIDKFIKAELAWIAFRDAEMDAIFPEEDKQLAYGSSYPMSYCIVIANLTWDRVKQLNEWLTAKEGDLSNGSRTPY